MPIGQPAEATRGDGRIPAAFRADASASLAGQRACVRARNAGYVQLIDADALMATAHDKDLVLRLQYQPGDFVHAGSTLLEAYPADRLDDEAVTALRSAFASGSRRTALQDLRFLIDELVEIAARALSPGVNDPFTANSCLDWLGAALADLAARDLPSRLRADEDDRVRVIAHPVTFAGFVDRAFGALSQYASADMIAGKRFLAALGDVALSCEAPERLAVLAQQARQFRDLADNALKGVNRDVVLERADELLRALAEPDYKRRLRDGQAWLGGTA